MYRQSKSLQTIANNDERIHSYVADDEQQRHIITLAYGYRWSHGGQTSSTKAFNTIHGALYWIGAHLVAHAETDEFALTPPDGEIQ